MKSTILLLALLQLTNASIVDHLIRRQSSSYVDSVCSPNITGNTGTIPPCISIVSIETQCQPNGTTPLDYLAHQECMCSPPSTYFTDWLACRNCIFVHGGLTQLEVNKNAAIISVASSSLCTGTPTAVFQSIFASVKMAGASVTSGSTVSSDQFPSQTAVSLYYTAAGKQGPGAITGSAAGATAKSLTTATSSKGSSASAASSGLSGSSSSSSSGQAMATKAAFLPGMAAAAIGGLVAIVV